MNNKYFVLLALKAALALGLIIACYSNHKEARVTFYPHSAKILRLTQVNFSSIFITTSLKILSLHLSRAIPFYTLISLLQGPHHLLKL